MTESRLSTTGRLREMIPDWSAHALCAEIGPEEWFRDRRDIEEEGRAAGLTQGEVVRVCRSCPAMRYCLRDALYSRSSVEPYGVWAGTNVRQRVEMRAAVDRRVTTVDDLADRIRTEGAPATAKWCFTELGLPARGRGVERRKAA